MSNEWNDGRITEDDGAAPLVRTGLVRNLNSKPVAVWAVSPAGHIKPLYVTVGVTPWMFNIKWIRRGERFVGIKKVELNADAISKGWRLLKDLYQAEDRMGDYASFLKHREQVVTRHLRKEIGDEYLPQSLLDYRDRRAEAAGTADLPPAEGAKKKAAKSKKTPSASEAFAP